MSKWKLFGLCCLLVGGIVHLAVTDINAFRRVDDREIDEHNGL